MSFSTFTMRNVQICQVEVVEVVDSIVTR